MRCMHATQIFGIKPCEMYKDMATEEFVEKHMATIKAPFHVQEIYRKNLVVLVIMVKHLNNICVQQ